ncbi:MAG: hypothetical protein M1827_001767 [Pycnora praestabilis]|nr:MAG: hypothetical protein M1827_001767 [Pycnora praestabilis]
MSIRQEFDKRNRKKPKIWNSPAMAPSTTTAIIKAGEGSPYRLDKTQVFKASSALLHHIKSHDKRKQDVSRSKNLLANHGVDSDEEVAEEDEVPIWLTVTTKKHIVDKKRLKPSKISLSHSLHSSPTSTICLITADPQRTFKDVIAHPSFPASLAPRITRTIGVSKLRARYKSYESCRQLRDEHDIFLADDRIVTQLTTILGSIFYKSGSKRPVPVNLAGFRKAKEEKKAAEDGKRVATPQVMANEIERTLSSALVNLSPSTNTSVKVGLASWSPEDLMENVEAVVNGLVDKFVTKGWRNIKAIHIKGPNTMALPLWLADELWVDEKDVLEDVPKPTEMGGDMKAIESSKAKREKRKTRDNEEDKSLLKVKKSKKGEGDDLAREIAMRKEQLKQQKAEAVQHADGDKAGSKAKAVKHVNGNKSGVKEKKTKAKAVAVV